MVGSGHSRWYRSGYSALGPYFEQFSLTDIPELGPQAGRGPGHLEGSPLAAQALGSAGFCPVFSRMSFRALQPFRGGDSQEGAAPRQGRAGAGLALLSLRFGGQRHLSTCSARNYLAQTTATGDSGLPRSPPDGLLFRPFRLLLPRLPGGDSSVHHFGHLLWGGLKGIMKLDDLTYEIKPIKYSERSEHVVSQIVADANATGPEYRPGHEEDRQPLLSEVNECQYSP